MDEYNQTWIEINQHAFDNNIQTIKRLVGDTAIALVLKANAYGHGLIPVATIAEENPYITYYCVISISEALHLREAGIKKPIMVLSHFDRPVYECIPHNITLCVSDYGTIQHIQDVGQQHNYTFSIHLKIDTGLHRLGIEPNDAYDVVCKINLMPNIALNGIYSHFAESAKEDQSFTEQQVMIFSHVLETLNIHNLCPRSIHIGNSAASIRALPFCTMIRVGAAAYGIWPSDAVRERAICIDPQSNLLPILSLKSKIIAFKKVYAGEYVGYDRTFQASHDMVCAILPVGYADGYDFRLSNNAHVLINNTSAPVIGRVAMNHTTIDVTHIPNVAIHDVATLIGPVEGIRFKDIAARIQAKNVRELCVGINPYINRIISHTIPFHKNEELLYTKAPHESI